MGKMSVPFLSVIDRLQCVGVRSCSDLPLFGSMLRWQHSAVFTRALNFLVRPNGTICTGFRLPLHPWWRNLLRFTKHQLCGQHVILYLGLSIIFSLQNLLFGFMFKVLERGFFLYSAYLTSWKAPCLRTHIPYVSRLIVTWTLQWVHIIAW
jgi:hypothetical protein